MSKNKKTSKIAHKKSQASHLQIIEPGSTGVPESGEAGHRSRSNSGSSRHPPAEARKDGKKKKSKGGREDSKDYQLRDVHILCENISQGVRSIKKEAVEEEEFGNPTSQDTEVEVSRMKTTPSSPHKRRREETPSPESNDERLNEIAAITEDVRNILLDDSSGLPLNIVKAVLNKCSMYERLLQKQMILNAKLEGEILALKEVNSDIKEIKEVCDQVKDVQDKTMDTSRSQSRTTYALVVKSTKKEEDPDDIIEKVSEVAQGVKIKSYRELKDGKGIVLITKEEKERSKLAEKINKLAKSLKVEERSLRNPRLVIHNVDNMHKDEFILSEIHQRNLDGHGTLEELKKSLKIVGHRNSVQFNRARHVILETTPEYYKRIMKNGGVYIDMEVFRVAEWEEVPRCFNCHQFDHYKKDCKEKKLCWKCCEPDHLAADCKNPPRCKNCIRKERTGTDHPATSRICPEYEWRLEMLRARTKPV